MLQLFEGDGGAIDAARAPQFSFLATPGHTPGHIVVCITPAGEAAPRAVYVGDALHVRCARAAALHTRCARAARSACSVYDASSHMQTAHSMQPHAALRCMPGRSQRKSNGPTGRPTLTAAAGRGSSRRRHGPRG
jgi:hypothetical protein